MNTVEVNLRVGTCIIKETLSLKEYI